MKWTVLTLICLAALFGRNASAQEMVPIPGLAQVDVSGPHLWGIAGHEIIYVKASADGKNPFMRCAVWDARTLEILNRTVAPPLHASDFKVVTKDGRPWVVVRRYLLCDVHPEDAKAEGATSAAIAAKWAKSVRAALPEIAPKPGAFGV